MHDLGAAGAQPLGEDRGVAVGAPGDGPQALRAVVDGVHARHDGEQHLRGADVAGGLLATDVLLTGLQREAVRLVAVGVDGDADEAARQAARHLLLHRHVTGVRSAEAHRDAEALRGAHRDVRAQLAWGLQQGEGQQIGGDGDERAPLVRLVDDRLDVPYGTGGAGVLDQDAVDLPAVEPGGDAVGQVGDDDLDAGRLGAGLDDGDGLRKGVRVDQEQALLVLAHAPGQRHRLGGRGALVQQRGAGRRQAGEFGDHRLEVQQRLEPSLRDLRLVRRVGRVPGGVLHHVAQDDGRGEGAVVPQADHRAEHLVAVGQAAQLGEHLGLAPGAGQVERVGVLDHVGYGGGGQLVEGAVADLGEHLRPGLVVGADVTLLEGDSLFELGERGTGAVIEEASWSDDLRGAPRRRCPDGLPSVIST